MIWGIQARNLFRIDKLHHPLVVGIRESGIEIQLEGDRRVRNWETGTINWAEWDRTVAWVEWRRRELEVSSN